jgi:curved DNA-binding protein CbpA
MTKRPDLYAILGVPPSATQAEISHAYRALLRRHHPDTRDPHDELQRAVSDAALQQVLAAYTVLHDPDRRAAYDQENEPPAPPPARPARRRSQHAPNRHGEYGQQPIIAGPVRWHRARHPPAP